ncbi:MAG: type II toxin-antitoxin system RelE/ParE family toxin [Candidatus Nealsonbacteria bacterium]
MKYQIVLPKRIKRKLDKIETGHYEKILSALEALSSDPYLGKRLKGELKSYYSYRVWSYRIIYEIRKKELVILVIRIGHRGGVYR